MNWHRFFNDTLPIFIGAVIISYLIGCITAVIISMHIESYCKKIKVDISESNPKSIFGTPQSPNENRAVLDKHTRQLSYIYSIITFVVLIATFL